MQSVIKLKEVDKMAVRRQINRYKTAPSGYDYKDVLQKGKRFYTIGSLHETFEMNPYETQEHTLWTANSVTLECYTKPQGTRTYSWNGTRYEEQ
jgi:hypothetical protein